MITSLEFIEVIFQFATFTFTDMINIGLESIFPAENAREATVVKHKHMNSKERFQTGILIEPLLHNCWISILGKINTNIRELLSVIDYSVNTIVLIFFYCFRNLSNNSINKNTIRQLSGNKTIFFAIIFNLCP